jgi:hypothetical protein
MTSDGLAAMERTIAEALSRRPEYFITHPAEMRPFERLSDDELKGFAARNGWRVVRRLGGRQLQFYNDTNERMLNEIGTTPAGATNAPARA